MRRFTTGRDAPPTRDPLRRRRDVVAGLRLQLHVEGFPRLQMTLLVMLTGFAGLLCSFLLLHLGIDSMALRYPLALVGANGVFLCLLWLWLRTTTADFADAVGEIDPSDAVDAIEAVADIVSDANASAGGAPGRFAATADAADAADVDLAEPIMQGLGAAGDADELALPLLLIAVVAALAVGAAIAAGYVIYVAPSLFAELLFDGILSYSLYRNLRGAPDTNWVATAMRRTALPFALTGVFLAIAGAGLSYHAPEAHTLGEALRHSSSAQR